MRQLIANKFKNLMPVWLRNNPRLLRLYELDAILDGEFYDSLRYSFYQQTHNNRATGRYIPITDRRPSFQYNLFNMLSNQLARKLFGGRHAPTLTHENEGLRKKFDAIKEEACLEEKMLEAVQWGSVGSVASVFQIVAFEEQKTNRSKVVVTNYRAKDCTPKFNKLLELEWLHIHYVVPGADFLNDGITLDHENKSIEPETAYWVNTRYTATEEVIFKPIKTTTWDPNKGFGVLVKDEELSFAHNLGFVPAHWFQYRTGKYRPYDGVCYWDEAVPNIIDLDYTVSQIGAGIRYNAVPQVVVKGQVLNAQEDGGLARGAERFIQIAADFKEGNDEEKNAQVYMLEAKGDAMKIGIESWASLVLRIAMQVICASLKDPNKVTTAMSGKGMEVIESEFNDLAQELRTVFGNGYVKLLKKIAAACSIKYHALFLNVALTEIDGLTLGWPPLASMSAAELQAMAVGLAELIKCFIITREEARAFAMSQLDMPVISTNKDYLPTVKTTDNEPVALSAKKQKKASISDRRERDDKKIEQMAQNAVNAFQQSATKGPIDFSFSPSVA